MRVLQINSVFGQGSTGRIAEAIHQYLRANGNESRVLYGRGPKSGTADAERTTTPLSVYGHVVGTRLSDRHGFFSTAASRRMVDIATEWKPDVVHLHNIHGYYLNIKVLFDYLAAAGVPVVWTLHDCWPFTGHCAYFDSRKCEKWKTECSECPLVHEYPASLVVDQSTRNFREKRELFAGLEAVTLVSPSAWLAGLAGESFLGHQRRMVIPNGIDTTLFRPTASSFRAAHGLGDRLVVLGVAGVWSKRKGLDDLAAMARLLGPEATVVILGQVRGRVELPPNVLNLNSIAGAAELAQIYSAADVFFNPTYEDNYPTTNLEAIACGTPVVTYLTGGSPEALTYGQGVAVPQGDLTAAAAAIREFVKVKRPGDSQPVTSLDATVMAAKYLKLYQELAGADVGA